MRRYAVRLITFVGGLYFLAEFLLPTKAPEWAGGFRNPLTAYRPVVTSFVVIVATMAFLLGPLNLVRSHVTRAFRKRKGWLESSVFLVSLAVAVLVTAMRTQESDTAAMAGLAGRKGRTATQATQANRPASGPAGTETAPASAPVAHKTDTRRASGRSPGRQARTIYDTVYHALMFGVSTGFFATSMALLAFYLISAAHRAFRMNNLESALMMVAAVVVMLGQVPAGDWITYRLPEPLQLRSAAQWILLFPNTGVQRAVLIGACAGALAAGLRHWLGLGTRME